MMITNKERLEQLVEQIKRLEKLTEEISEKEIYPVSFFSRAFDITNMIIDDLQQMEIFQIELIEKQKKEHIAQLLSLEEIITHPKESPPANGAHEPVEPPKAAPPPVSRQAESENLPPVTPPKFAPPPVPVPSIQPVHPVQEEKRVIPSHLFEQKSMIDLKKMITLNDRFLFCRELFANNEQMMNQVLSELNREESYNASVDYLQKRFEWDFDDKNVTDFLSILKKKFA